MTSERQKYCELIELAIERQKQDLIEGPKRGLYFDEKKANRVIRFISSLKHSKGEFAGKPFIPEPWQVEYILKPLFGWYKPRFEWDESKPFDWDKHPYDPKSDRWVRRFNVATIELPKKTGKSTLGSAVGCYMMAADREPVSEVYSVAYKKEQAKLIHEEGKRMIMQSPIESLCDIIRDNISMPITQSAWKILTKMPKGNDGINPHCSLVDELHQWPWAAKDLLDILLYSNATRRSPLTFIISTAGDDTNSLFYTKVEQAIKILRGEHKNDSVFCFIAEPTKEELDRYGWDNPILWKMINPNLGVTIPVSKFKELAETAAQNPIDLQAFKRYWLNVWSNNAKNRMLNLDAYYAPRASFIPDFLKKKTCYLGLDLSNRIDLTALIAVFPDWELKHFAVMPFFWVPAQNVEMRVKKDDVPYFEWIRTGHLLTTPGNSVDYEYIAKKIDHLYEEYDVKLIAADPWNLSGLGTELENRGYQVIQVRQGFKSLNNACKFLQEAVLAGTLLHNDHPVLRWNAENLVARVDANGNIAPDKEHSTEKIDGMSALINALTIAIGSNAQPKKSVYNKKGLLILDGN